MSRTSAVEAPAGIVEGLATAFGGSPARDCRITAGEELARLVGHIGPADLIKLSKPVEN
jgi:hypothetical protein